MGHRPLNAPRRTPQAVLAIDAPCPASTFDLRETINDVIAGGRESCEGEDYKSLRKFTDLFLKISHSIVIDNEREMDDHVVMVGISKKKIYRKFTK